MPPIFASQACSCETGIDCCSGHCVVDETSGESVCGNGGACSADLNACVESSDCCNAEAIWAWGAVERVSTGLLCTRIGLQPVGRDMLAAAEAVAAVGHLGA